MHFPLHLQKRLRNWRGILFQLHEMFDLGYLQAMVSHGLVRFK